MRQTMCDLRWEKREVSGHIHDICDHLGHYVDYSGMPLLLFADRKYHVGVSVPKRQVAFKDIPSIF